MYTQERYGLDMTLCSAAQQVMVCVGSFLFGAEDCAFSVLALLREHQALPTPIGQQDRRACGGVPDRLFASPPHAPPRLFPATTLPRILPFRRFDPSPHATSRLFP